MRLHNQTTTALLKLKGSYIYSEEQLFDCILKILDEVVMTDQSTYFLIYISVKDVSTKFTPNIISIKYA